MLVPGVALLFRRKDGGRSGKIWVGVLFALYWILSTPIAAVALVDVLSPDVPLITSKADARGATAIAAFSTRAKPGAPVSVPIEWDELSGERPSDYFTVMNVPERLKHLRRDPWEQYSRSARRVTADMIERLEVR